MLTKNMCENVHGCPIHNCPKLKSPPMPVSTYVMSRAEVTQWCLALRMTCNPRKQTGTSFKIKY